MGNPMSEIWNLPSIGSPAQAMEGSVSRAVAARARIVARRGGRMKSTFAFILLIHFGVNHAMCYLWPRNQRR
jgi:hypothetical protein